ncbi:hypothetical protein L6Q96_22160 [Candidatus Binatia bacterium]|nr:hypothetical protein [Candidatus Binatia bacterium]
MVDAMSRAALPASSFDEQQFYLDEFRGRTLLFAIPLEEFTAAASYESFATIVRTLLGNDTRVIVLVSSEGAGDPDQLAHQLRRRVAAHVFRNEVRRLFPTREQRHGAFLPLDPAAFAAPGSATAALAALWNRLRHGPFAVGVLAATARNAAVVYAQHVASRLRVHKLVIVEPEGGVAGTDRKQISFMDEAMLEALLETGEAEWTGLAARRHTFEAARAALLAGVGAVNVCSLDGLARELFTYSGSGTLFTRAVYCTVQRLGVDDFEEVERLIARGQREGLLKVRSDDEIATLLVNGYGATIGAHHLAGICALVTEPYTAECAGELAGLYTITRFKGEGVGGRLVAKVLNDARASDLAYLFACTMEQHAAAFFERQGFRRVGTGDVPAAKWSGYDPHRREQVIVLRLDLTQEAT